MFDRFHIVRLMNEKLTALRRELTDLPHREVVMGTRWLLLKKTENIKNEPGR